MIKMIEVDPTGLLPGDVVISLSEHEISGCHCDVRVTVERETDPASEEKVLRLTPREVEQVERALKEVSDYIPRPGDIVKFPEAPRKANQDRIYEITGIRRHGYKDEDLSWVSFRLFCGDGAHVYDKELTALQSLGMKLVRSVDKLDPTWNGES